MASVTRRTLLSALGSAAAIPWLGRCAASDASDGEAVAVEPLPPEPEPIVPWGLPTARESVALPPVLAESILEVFLLGGVNPWDTFYVVPEHGDAARGGPNAGQQWWTFQSGPENLPDAFDRCGGGARSLYEPFAAASDGKTINLGPFIYPLRDRPDILKRMRIVVVSHDKEPHQTAVPLVLTGLPQGSPRAAGFAAHVARHFNEVTPRDAPWSYVLLSETATVSALEADVAASPGLHPGAARPMTLRMVADNPVARGLTRPAYGEFRTQADAALDYYRRDFLRRLTPRGAQEALYSRHFADYEHAAIGLVRGGDSLATVFTPEVLVLPPGQECGVERPTDGTIAGMRLARHLLTRGEHRPKYVQIVDTGLVEGSNGGYDTHEHHIRDASTSVVHAARAIADAINRPDENDPEKLDLDRHMVVLTTEMGRTPFPQSGSQQLLGLNHWPHGFVCVVIGGPIEASQSGVAGSIGEDGRATEWVTPAEFRSGLLLSLGIWPFSPEAFAVGHVRGVEEEIPAADVVRERVLGFSA